jgi:hypothetical protein
MRRAKVSRKAYKAPFPPLRSLEDRADALEASNRRLSRALIYMLWRSVADSAMCTCHPRDVCPECKACKALGLGRWKGADTMQPKIQEAERQLRRRSR